MYSYYQILVFCIIIIIMTVRDEYCMTLCTQSCTAMVGVLCCFALFVCLFDLACLTLLASFFLPSRLSLKDVHT